MRREYEPKGVAFLALSLEPDEQEVLEAANRLGLEMPVAIVEGEVLGPLGVNQVPSTVFVDREGTIVAAARGTIVAAASGDRSRSFFERRVKALLGP